MTHATTIGHVGFSLLEYGGVVLLLALVAACGYGVLRGWAARPRIGVAQIRDDLTTCVVLIDLQKSDPAAIAAVEADLRARGIHAVTIGVTHLEAVRLSASDQRIEIDHAALPPRRQ